MHMKCKSIVTVEWNNFHFYQHALMPIKYLLLTTYFAMSQDFTMTWVFNT